MGKLGPETHRERTFTFNEAYLVERKFGERDCCFTWTNDPGREDPGDYGDRKAHSCSNRRLRRKTVRIVSSAPAFGKLCKVQGVDNSSGEKGRD